MDLTPTGQSYFDNQTSEYRRILKNAKDFAKEVCPNCGKRDFSIEENGKRTCTCTYQWTKK